jgi:hypothetical protein
MLPSPTERTFDPARAKMLREKAEAGQLIAFNWATAKFGDKEYRMNGQHSSSVLTELNGQFPQGLNVHVDTYESMTLTGLRSYSGNSITGRAGVLQQTCRVLTRDSTLSFGTFLAVQLN